MKAVLAVDLGATNLRIAIVDEEGTIKSFRKTKTPRSGGADSIPRRIVEVIRDLGTADAESIGISSIGPLDMRNGVIVRTPNLPYDRIEVKRTVEELGLDVYMINDAMAGALGENVFGAGRGFGNMVYVTFSTGLGGGAIVDGRLIVGRAGNAHEIGHLVVDYDGDLACGCGGMGHWEAYCSGSGLPKLAKLLANRRGGGGKFQRLVEEGIEAPEIFEYARKGDDLALEVVEEFSRIAAAGIASVASAYDPEIILLGGPVYLRNRDLLDARIRSWLTHYSIGGMPINTAAAGLGEDAPLIGAAVAALRRWKPWR